jgi:hypothetical protein
MNPGSPLTQGVFSTVVVALSALLLSAWAQAASASQESTGATPPIFLDRFMKKAEAELLLNQTLRDAVWVPLAPRIKGVVAVDFKSLTSSAGGEIITAWFNFSGTLRGVSMDCSRRRVMYWDLIIRPDIFVANSEMKSTIWFSFPDEENELAISADKLCGTLVPKVGLLYRILFVGGEVSWYWLPSGASRNGQYISMPIIVITNPYFTRPRLDATNKLFNLIEIDCGSLRYRHNSYGGSAWGEIPPIPDSAEWKMVNEGGQIAFRRACADPAIQPIVSKSSAGDIREPLSGAIEKAKVKCAELGFAKGTEKFAGCVLKLSK